MEIGSSRIIVGILARDCKDAVMQNRPEIQKLCACFGDYYIVIVENDSIDGTKEVLAKWRDEDPKVVLDTFDGIRERTEGKSVSRIARMVSLRNRLLDDIRELPPSDYIVFIDIDLYAFRSEGIVQGILSAPKDWGALLANGRNMLPNHKHLRLQYDTYALLKDTETWKDVTERSLSKYNQTKKGLYFDKRVQRNAFYPVASAFGGIGVYKYEAIKDINYQVVTLQENKSVALCEHIPFHNQIKDKGYKLYLSRSMQTNYGILNTNKLVTFEFYHFPLLHTRLLQMRDILICSKFFRQKIVN